jgi:hypothetical protein
LRRLPTSSHSVRIATDEFGNGSHIHERRVWLQPTL